MMILNFQDTITNVDLSAVINMFMTRPFEIHFWSKYKRDNTFCVVGSIAAILMSHCRFTCLSSLAMDCAVSGPEPSVLVILGTLAASEGAIKCVKTSTYVRIFSCFCVFIKLNVQFYSI